MMKKIYVGALLVSMLTQPVFAMEEERKSDSMHTVVRSPEEQKKLNEELCDVVIDDDLGRAEELIKRGADVNARVNGFTALRWACIFNKSALVKLFVLHADVNAKDMNGGTCLHQAEAEAVKILLACKHIEVNVVDDGGATPLLDACLLDHSDVAKLLLKSFIKPAFSWQQQRLIWAGWMKEEQVDCNLAKLPVEMIYHIISFCGDKRNNIEALKGFICHQTENGYTAFDWLGDDIKKELGHILDPQAWQDDQTAEKTYDALVKLLQEDEKKQSNQNGKEEQE